MSRFTHDTLRSEPNEDECRTEQLMPRFSRCLKKETKCVYAVLTGSYYYCMHPNHLDFRATSLLSRYPYE